MRHSKYIITSITSTCLLHLLCQLFNFSRVLLNWTVCNLHLTIFHIFQKYLSFHEIWIFILKLVISLSSISQTFLVILFISNSFSIMTHLLSDKGGDLNNKLRYQWLPPCIGALPIECCCPKKWRRIRRKLFCCHNSFQHYHGTMLPKPVVSISLWNRLHISYAIRPTVWILFRSYYPTLQSGRMHTSHR